MSHDRNDQRNRTERDDQRNQTDRDDRSDQNPVPRYGGKRDDLRTRKPRERERDESERESHNRHESSRYVRGGRRFDEGTSDRASRQASDRFDTRRPSRSTVEAGNPHEGSQRGSHRETGIAGRLGGQRGSHHRHGDTEQNEPHEEVQYGGERGGDERDRRYGSRRGNSSQRRGRRR